MDPLCPLKGVLAESKEMKKATQCFEPVIARIAFKRFTALQHEQTIIFVYSTIQAWVNRLLAAAACCACMRANERTNVCVCECVCVCVCVCVCRTHMF